VAGSGTYTGKGSALRLIPERWLSARNGIVSYARSPVDATLDAKSLRIAGEEPMLLRPN
jgi:hypothetical protein